MNIYNGAAAVTNVFEITNPHLKFPLYRNWTAAVEQRLPRNFTLNVTGLRKRGRDGLAYTPTAVPGIYDLANSRRDSYDAAEFAVHQKLHEQYEWMASYTRSRAHSNSVIDFDVDQPLQVTGNSGPLSWDTPNRFLSWGFLPTKWQSWALAYSMEARTGFPYSVINEASQIVGPVNSQRFPMFLSLNIHPEYRFKLFGRRWAVRGGFNNITNHRNPVIAETIPGVPVRLFGSEGRHFVFRVRWLGRAD